MAKFFANYTQPAIFRQLIASGGKSVLDELVERARTAGLYDLDYGPDPYDKPPPEPLDEGTAGIGALLAIFSLLGVVLAVVAVIEGVQAIMRTGG